MWSFNKRIIDLNIFETVIRIKTQLFIFHRGFSFIFLLFRRLSTHDFLKSISLYELNPFSLIYFINGYPFILKCKEKVNKFWYLICIIIFLFFSFLHSSFIILKLHHKIQCSFGQIIFLSLNCNGPLFALLARFNILNKLHFLL